LDNLFGDQDLNLDDKDIKLEIFNIYELLEAARKNINLKAPESKIEEMEDLVTLLKKMQAQKQIDSKEGLIEFLKYYQELKLWNQKTPDTIKESLATIAEDKEKRGYGENHAQLAELLERMSIMLDKDIITDLIKRNDLSKEVSVLEKIHKELQDSIAIDTSAIGEMTGILNKDIIVEELPETHKHNISKESISRKISDYISSQLRSIEEGRFEYDDKLVSRFDLSTVSKEKKEQEKRELMRLLKLKDIKELTDIKNLAFLLQLAERKDGLLTVIEKIRDSKNDELKEYFPSFEDMPDLDDNEEDIKMAEGDLF